MKTIQPVKVWYNGSEVDATILNASIQNDNLKDSATFNYQLMALFPSGMQGQLFPMSVANNFLTMTGEDYEKWDTNDYAYEWIAKKLNLVITGEYVQPVPVPPTPPAPVAPIEPAPAPAE